jgi:hypothetical protein
MGASNFARGNTSKVFAVLMDTKEKFSKCNECNEKSWEWEEDYVEVGGTCSCGSTDVEHDTEYRSCEDFEYNDFVYDLRETAERKASKQVYKYQKEDASDRANSYCATDLFSLRTSKCYGDIAVELQITGQIVSGYYEGASLDYRLEVYNGGEWSEVDKNFSAEDIVTDLFEASYSDHSYSSMGKGLRKILSKKASVWAERETSKMEALVEEIFTEVSQPLNVVATFSNGETIYEKAN